MRKYLLQAALLMSAIGCVTDSDVGESGTSSPQSLESLPNGEGSPVDGGVPLGGETPVDPAGEGEGEGEISTDGGEGEVEVVVNEGGNDGELVDLVEVLEGHELPCDGSVEVSIDGDHIKAEFSSLESSKKNERHHGWWMKKSSKLECAFEIVLKAKDEGKKIIVDKVLAEGEADVNSRSRPEVSIRMNSDHDRFMVNNSGPFSVPMGLSAYARCGRPLRMRVKMRAKARAGSVVSMKRMLMHAQVRDCGH